MEEIEEVFISGFCRTNNETRTVCCEYERQADGSFLMTEFDCNYEKCAHHGSCLIYKEARAQEKGV